MIPMWKRAAVFSVAALFTGAFLIDFCGWIFGCGCQSIWKAMDRFCNIHTGPKHCPWCTHGGVGFLFAAVMVFGTQAWIAFRAVGLPLFIRLALCLFAFPTIGALAAYLVGHLQGYWNP